MEEFEADSLLRLLQTYETAIAELQKLHDPAFTDLIARYTKRRAEVFAALATAFDCGANSCGSHCNRGADTSVN